MKYINPCIFSHPNEYSYFQDVLSQEVKPIQWSDHEKELLWRHPEEQRKQVVKNFSETFVKNAF